MKIDKAVLEVLDECKIEGNLVYLPERQLDRKLYVSVNKVLEILGGKWNKKSKAHVFDSDPTENFDAVVQTQEIIDPKKVFQFFETPVELAKEMVEMAVKPGDLVLEPSAGLGAIAFRLLEKGAKIKCIELNPDMEKFLSDNKFDVQNANFLQLEPAPIYDAIVMNPPFSKQQEIDHIIHAYRFLKPDGILVSVISEGPFFRTNKKAVAFREFLDATNADVKTNPPGTFKNSGTNVNTRIVKIQRKIVSLDVNWKISF